MPCSTEQERLQFHQLEAEYRNAWRGFCLEVCYWQALTSDVACDEARIKLAEKMMDEAELIVSSNTEYPCGASPLAIVSEGR